MILNSPYISGSLTVTGNTTIQGQLTVTGSLSGTASLASNALLLQGTGSTGFATTGSINEVSASQQSISASLLQVSASYIALSGSYNVFSGSASTRITENSSSIQQVSASLLQVSASYIALSGSYTTFSGSASTRTTQIEQVYATTGSNSFRADQSITGSLVVSSTITAQTLVVQTVTSSIVYSSGSNIFGCDLNSRQTFTGSVLITGSLTIAGASSATSYSGARIYSSTVACSPIGCFATSCATSFIGGSITGTYATFGADVVGDPIYLRIQNDNTGGYPSSLALSIYGYSSSPAGYYDQFRIRATYPGYGATDFIVKEQAQSSEVIALTIRGTGISCFSKAVCACLFTAPTISAGTPTNSRILANASTIYGYYDVEVNPRWTLGRDVWAGGSGGLAFGVGGTTTCYSMIGDPSGYGCTIAFATLVPSGCSGTTYEKMRITSCGKVGIGSTNPNWLLEICCNTTATGGGGYPAISINNPNDAGYSALYFFKGVNNFGGLELSNATCHLFVNTQYTFAIQTNNTERLRVSNNGFIGVATNSPKSQFDVAYGTARSTTTSWCKYGTSGTMYGAFNIVTFEASFAGQLYVQSAGSGIAIQATYDVLSSYDRICVILRNCMNRGNGETLNVLSFAEGGGSKRICIQQSNTGVTAMHITAMLVGTSYGDTYICQIA